MRSRGGSGELLGYYWKVLVQSEVGISDGRELSNEHWLLEIEMGK